MKKTIIIISFLAGIGFSSCKKELNLAPISQISNSSFWKTPYDATAAAAGMYVGLRGQATNNLYIWGELRSDAIGPNTNTPVFQDWYLNILDPQNSSAIFSGATTNWSGMYSLIHTCNLILDRVPDISFPSESAKNNILAQAHAMRAYVYYVLAKTWGGVPIVTHSTIDLSDVQMPRASVEEVFTLIKSDIDEAIKLYPDNSFPAYRCMWSLPATQALKADVYLWTAKRMNGGTNDLNTALTACNEVQKADVSLLPNFVDVFDYDNKGNNEILFAVRRTYEEDNEPTIYAWAYTADNVIPPSTDQATRDEIGATGGAPFMSPSTIARNVFSADDPRKKASLIEIYGKDDGGNKVFFASVIKKFNGTEIAGQRYFISDYIVYRYADVLLMKAEAENALGTDPSAEINLVRKRAFGANYASHVFVNGTKAANDDAILNERFKELMFEGKRWWDLVRFDKAFDLVPSLQSRKGQDNLLLFPIPTVTLSLNAKLSQNPGY